MLVMISGQQGSGKTTLSKGIYSTFLDRGYHVIRARFAQPLYDMHDAVREVLGRYGYTNYNYDQKDGPLLQLLGTEWGRQIDPNIWVNILKGSYQFARDTLQKDGLDPDAHLIFIVEDCRFKNELDSFPEAISIRLECAEEIRKERCEMWRNRTNHPSEIDLDDYVMAGRFDLVLNSGELSEKDTIQLAAKTIIDPELYRKKYGISKIHEGTGLEPASELLASGSEEGVEKEVHGTPPRQTSGS